MAYNIQQFQSGCQCIIAEINFLSTFFKKMSKSAAGYPKQCASFVPLNVTSKSVKTEKFTNYTLYFFRSASSTKGGTISDIFPPNLASSFIELDFSRRYF